MRNTLFSRLSEFPSAVVVSGQENNQHKDAKLNTTFSPEIRSLQLAFGLRTMWILNEAPLRFGINRTLVELTADILVQVFKKGGGNKNKQVKGACTTQVHGNTPRH